MSTDDPSAYRPKSPDLSSFFSGPGNGSTENAPHQHDLYNPVAGHQQQQRQPAPLDTSSLHHQNQPYLQHQSPSQPPQQSYAHPHPQSHNQPQYPQTIPPPAPYDYSYSPQTAPAPARDHSYSSPSFAGGYPASSSPQVVKAEDSFSPIQQQPEYPDFGQRRSPGSIPKHHHHSHSSGSFSQPPYEAYPPNPYSHTTQPDYNGTSQASASYIPPFQPTGALPGPAPNQDSKDFLETKFNMPQDAPAEESKPAASRNIPEVSPVKTKFPTARIKRIMQADEEVGKVAQQTPIAVGKALEMFMVQMVLTSADVAKEKGSKRVTAQTLKQVVEQDEQWDFLRDIVSKVEVSEKNSKTKGESDSDEEEQPKKRGRGGGRKKKAAA